MWNGLEENGARHSGEIGRGHEGARGRGIYSDTVPLLLTLHEVNPNQVRPPAATPQSTGSTVTIPRQYRSPDLTDHGLPDPD